MEKNYPKYQLKKDSLQHAIGDVVARWANLEHSFLGLAQWSLRTDLEATGKILSTFRNFSLMLDFCHKVCASRLSETAFLDSLIDLTREVAGCRNFIAHTPIVAHGEGPPDKADWAQATPKVGPSASLMYAGQKQKRAPMSESEVREVAQDIQHLINETQAFQGELDNGSVLTGRFLEPVIARRPRISERQEHVTRTHWRLK